MTVLSSTKTAPQTSIPLGQKIKEFARKLLTGGQVAHPENVEITEVSLRRMLAKARRCNCSDGYCASCEHIYRDISPL